MCVTFPNSQEKEIQNIIYVLGTKKNIISIYTIANQFLKVEFIKSQCFVKDTHNFYKVLATRFIIRGLYKIDVTRKNHQALASTTMSKEELWHHKYGHVNHNDLMLLQNKEIVKGLQILKNEHI
jgi:hypothetical protein